MLNAVCAVPQHTQDVYTVRAQCVYWAAAKDVAMTLHPGMWGSDVSGYPHHVYIYWHACVVT